MKNLLVAGLILSSTIANAGWFSDNDKEAREDVIKMSRALNSNTPRLMDRHTRLDTTLPVGKTLVYVFTISDQVVALGKNNVIKKQLPKAINNFCTQPKLKETRDYNQSFKYLYNKVDGTHFLSYTVSNKDCK